MTSRTRAVSVASLSVRMIAVQFMIATPHHVVLVQGVMWHVVFSRESVGLPWPAVRNSASLASELQPPAPVRGDVSSSLRRARYHAVPACLTFSQDGVPGRTLVRHD